MSRKVNTLELCLYNGPGPAWRGGWRQCVVYWRDAKRARLLDLGTLILYRVKLSTLAPPYMVPLQSPMRGTLKRLAIFARERQRSGVEVPLETIGSILEEGKRQFASVAR